jgi:hypothetical protein
MWYSLRSLVVAAFEWSDLAQLGSELVVTRHLDQQPHHDVGRLVEDHERANVPPVDAVLAELLEQDHALALEPLDQVRRVCGQHGAAGRRRSLGVGRGSRDCHDQRQQQSEPPGPGSRHSAGRDASVCNVPEPERVSPDASP